MESYNQGTYTTYHERPGPGCLDAFLYCTNLGGDDYHEYDYDYGRDPRDRYDHPPQRGYNSYDHYRDDITPPRSRDRDSRDYSPKRDRRGYESESSFTSSDNYLRKNKKKDKKKTKSDRDSDKKSKDKRNSSDKKTDKKSKKSNSGKEKSKDKSKDKKKSKSRGDTDRDKRDDGLSERERKPEAREDIPKPEQKRNNSTGSATLDRLSRKMASMFSGYGPEIPNGMNHQNQGPMPYNMQQGPSFYGNSQRNIEDTYGQQQSMQHMNSASQFMPGTPPMSMPSTPIINNRNELMFNAHDHMMPPQSPHGNFHRQSTRRVINNGNQNFDSKDVESPQYQSPYNPHKASMHTQHQPQQHLHPQLQAGQHGQAPMQLPAQQEKEENTKPDVPALIGSGQDMSDAVSAITMIKIQAPKSTRGVNQSMNMDRAMQHSEREKLTNDMYQNNGLMEAIIPPGDLSIVLSSTPEGLMIERLSDSSIARDLLHVGDKIVALDGIDVSYFS